MPLPPHVSIPAATRAHIFHVHHLPGFLHGWDSPTFCAVCACLHATRFVARCGFVFVLFISFAMLLRTPCGLSPRTTPPPHYAFAAAAHFLFPYFSTTCCAPSLSCCCRHTLPACVLTGSFTFHGPTYATCCLNLYMLCRFHLPVACLPWFYYYAFTLWLVLLPPFCLPAHYRSCAVPTDDRATPAACYLQHTCHSS